MIRKRKPKVFVMMSGGVDSSVAALLLKRSGKYEVFGAFIKGYNIDGCQEKEAEDARRAAEFLNIPFYVIDLEKDYKKLVVDYMIDGYKKGITPNPDVMCNKEIKFGLFLEKALSLGADYVATGHYVKLAKGKRQRANGKIKKPLAISYSLLAARDAQKDQSYFLWTLTQKQLKHCLFPIGDYLKSEVRQIAKKAGLPTAEKKESQGICFLGQINVGDFLKKRIKTKKGDIIDTKGKKVGTHDGVWFYTIGQRRGLGIGGAKKPYYVADKDIKKNILVVAEENNQELYKNNIELTNVNIINSVYSLIRANKGINVLARVRYRQPLAKAKLILNPRQSAFKSASISVLFDNPQKFVASGQSAVFYEQRLSANSGLKLLGGGVIK